MAWSDEQLANARTIYSVGKSLGMSDRDIQIGLATAIVESGLVNVNYGDRDSLGLFQQRPSQGWGTPQQVTDPRYAATRFFNALKGLGERRNSMDMGAAAQAVQRSAFPDRYGERMGEAGSILAGLGGAMVPGSGVDTTSVDTVDTLGKVADLDSLLEPGMGMTVEAPSVTEVNGVGEVTADEAGIGALTFEDAAGQVGSPVDSLSFDQALVPKADPMASVKMPTLDELRGVTATTEGSIPTAEGGTEGWRSAIVSAARKMLGTPYVWGGTSYSGVDCSGLIALLYGKQGFSLPRVSADQARSGRRVGLDQLRPGDFVAWDNSSRNNGADHIAIYIGGGQIIEAPRPGGVVQVNSIYDVGNAWGVAIDR